MILRMTLENIIAMQVQTVGVLAHEKEATKTAKVSALLLVVPVTGFLAEFLPVSLVVTVPLETFMFHSSGCSRVQ